MFILCYAIQRVKHFLSKYIFPLLYRYIPEKPLSSSAEPRNRLNPHPLSQTLKGRFILLVFYIFFFLINKYIGQSTKVRGSPSAPFRACAEYHRGFFGKYGDNAGKICLTPHRHSSILIHTPHHNIKDLIMVMPRYSISYEQTFHILLELLSDPATEGPIEVEQPSEKEATFFRLRYYSFQRTVFAEAERELEHSLKHGDAKGLEEARQKLNKAKRTKRFTVRLKNTEGKHFVVFSDRDLKYASINDKLLAMLTQQHTHDPKANAEIDSIFANAKQAKDNAFMDLLNKPKLDTSALTPTQAFLAETADPKPSLVRSPQWHLEQTILILKHSPKMHTFTREVLGLADQTWFLQELANTPNLPPHKAAAHNAGVDIVRISSEGTGSGE